MRKLSKKEENEVVTKGFLKATLENGDYVSRKFLKDQNYVTKDFLKTVQAEITADVRRHTHAMHEEYQSRLEAVVELLIGRFDRMEVRLDGNDARFNNHEGRLQRLEQKRV